MVSLSTVFSMHFSRRHFNLFVMASLSLKTSIEPSLTDSLADGHSWDLFKPSISMRLKASMIVSECVSCAERERESRTWTCRRIDFNRFGSSMERVLTDMSFPTTWTPETVSKVDNHFRSKYSVGDGLNEKKQWRNERLLALAKHKQTYVDRDYRIVRYPLHVPTDGGRAMIEAIEHQLKKVYKQVNIKLVTHDEATALDLSAAPWKLAGKSLGSNGIFCQLGRVPKTTECNCTNLRQQVVRRTWN